MTKNKKTSAETEVKDTSIQIIAQQSPLVNSKKPFTNEQVNLITRTVAKGATPDELKLFLIVANKTGLDPFSKQIHFVKRKQKQKDGSYLEVGAIQTGIDGYRAIAERSGGYAGSDEPIYDTEDAKNPNKATVTIYKIIQGVRCPFTAAARWGEYCPPSPMDFMWRKMPYLMLGKTAEALALRKAFPNDLSGIYVDSEVEREGAVVEASEVTAKKPEPVKEAKVFKGEVVETVENTALQNLFNDARNFGAKSGEEAIFIQEVLGKDIEWLELSNANIAIIRTELMANCVQNGGAE